MAGDGPMRHYYLAALIFLCITLVSGAWLRMMWAYPILASDLSAGVLAEDLLHAHSHVALLGWVFLGLFALTFEAGTRVGRVRHSPVRITSLLGGVLAALAVLMFVAFARQGYAPASITLSTLHMLGGFVLAGIYFRHADTGRNETAGHFLEGSVFWLLVASAGPLMLAAGSRLTPFWMTSAVQYYLHVLFNGWILFALAGLGWRYLVRPVHYRVRWPFWLMMVGLLPSLLPRLPFEEYGGWMALVALTGSLLYTIGGVGGIVYVVLGVWRGVPAGKWRDMAGGMLQGMSAGKWRDMAGGMLRGVPAGKWRDMAGDKLRGMPAGRREGGGWSGSGALIGRGGTGGVVPVLFWSGMGSMAVVLMLPPVLALPSMHALWADSSWVIVGYLHLLLLGGASALLQFALWKRLIGSPHNTRRWHRMLAGWGAAAFVVGSWLMTLVLFHAGLVQQLALSPVYQVQKVLFFTGVLTIAGFAALWLAGYCMRASISSSNSP